MRRYKEHILISADPENIFAYVDDHARFSSHMNKSSWMMGGGKMDVSVDEGHGQKVGSHIRMGGKVLGISLFLDEVVTRHEPPNIKEWKTVGALKLIVVGHYTMKVEIKPQDGKSQLTVSIDYELPEKNAWLGKLFGGMYARWCVGRMTKDTQKYFVTQK